MFKRTLRKRLRSLEAYLDVAYAEDGYGDYEHLPKKWSKLEKLEEAVRELRDKSKDG